MPDRFVWVSVNGKLWPQRWVDDTREDLRMEISQRPMVYAMHLLSHSERSITLDELARKYPAPSHVGEISTQVD
jgi:hypothetical protein